MARGGRRAGAGAPKGAANGAAKKAAITRALRPSQLEIIPKPPRKKKVRLSPMDEIIAALGLVNDVPKCKSVTDISTEPLPTDESYDPDLTPMDFLLNVMRNPFERSDRRDKAAALLLPFQHVKAGETGKKEDRKKAASDAASGKFAVPKPPLRAVK